VSEIDRGVVTLDRERLGYDPASGIEVRVEDGRLGLTRLASGSQDLVLGDAFGGISVPWHLTTREAVRQVKRVLTGDGTYTVNMIDRGPLAFARAEVATLAAEFDHVALLARTDTLARTGGGNLVAVASPAPIDVGGIAARLARTDTGWGVITGAELDAWVDGAPVLTDDYAPVDQLLTPYVSS
jgi:spermidine synthase